MPPDSEAPQGTWVLLAATLLTLVTLKMSWLNHGSRILQTEMKAPTKRYFSDKHRNSHNQHQRKSMGTSMMNTDFELQNKCRTFVTWFQLLILGLKLYSVSRCLTIQKKARSSSTSMQYCFLCCTQWFLLLSLWMKPQRVTIQKKAVEQYF